VFGPGARAALDRVSYLRQLNRAVIDKVLSTWVAHGLS
jgi:hypothetical protein